MNCSLLSVFKSESLDKNSVTVLSSQGQKCSIQSRNADGVPGSPWVPFPPVPPQGAGLGHQIPFAGDSFLFILPDVGFYYMTAVPPHPPEGF